MSRPLRPFWECAAAGALSFAWLALLSVGSSVAIGRPWLVHAPLEALAFYAVLGGALGLAAGGLAFLLRPDAARRALLLALVLAPALLRLFGSLKLHLGRWGGWGPSLGITACTAALVLATALVVERRRGTRAGLLSALRLGLWSTTSVLAVHALLVADPVGTPGIGPRGWTVVFLVVGAALAGAGLWIATERRPLSPLGPWLLLALVLLVGVRLRAAAPRARSEARAGGGPSVLLVVLDTLRRDVVGCYGLHEGVTPALDRLAREGVVWDDAVSSGCWTVPAHASLFTGVPVSRHGAGHLRTFLRERPGGEDTPPLPTLAELFRAKGYATAAVVCNPSLPRGRGFERGFQDYVELFELKPHDHDVLEFLRRALLRHPWDKGGERAVAAAGDWIADHAGAPWFLFLNLNEAHRPYDTAPRELRAAWLDHEPSQATKDLLRGSPVFASVDPGEAVLDELWRLYLSVVAYQDRLLGRLLDRLDERVARDDVIVLVTSDHGEHFGRLGLLGHGQSLDDDLVRVPLVARAPGLPRGAHDATPVGLLDVLPTLVAWADLEAPPADPARLGRPLTSTAGRDRVVERYPAFRERVEELEAYAERVGWHVERRWAWGRASLRDGSCAYEEVEGPEEPVLTCGGVPVVDERRQRTLAERLAELRASWPRALEEAPPPEREEVLRRTRALGYLR